MTSSSRPAVTPACHNGPNSLLVNVPSYLVNDARTRHDRLVIDARRTDRLGNRLRVARAERDLSQDGLARAVGVSRNTISSIETGRYTPSALLAFRIADALDMPITSIFWIEGVER
jgi:putative transcriptional regulator